MNKGGVRVIRILNLELFIWQHVIYEQGQFPLKVKQHFLPSTLNSNYRLLLYPCLENQSLGNPKKN